MTGIGCALALLFLVIIVGAVYLSYRLCDEYIEDADDRPGSG